MPSERASDPGVPSERASDPSVLRRRRAAVDVTGLVSRARDGDFGAVARLITLVENDSPALREVAAALAPHTGRASVLGITGAPGVGKSTSTSALVRSLRADGRRVGVLAVDPSSPYSGGALLGDRIRMQDHAGDDGVYIRSMASRGHLGGLAVAVPQALRVLDAAGYDTVLIETVGVGQAEVAVASLADTTVVLVAPGMGDAVQAAKAGILEVADVLVVNKADRDGAEQVVRDLRGMQSLAGPPPAGTWRAPIVSTTASRGEGVDEVRAAIARHRDWLVASGERERRRVARAGAEIEALALAQVSRRFSVVGGPADLAALAARVAAGDTDPYTAADAVVATLGSGDSRTHGSAGAGPSPARR